MTAILKAPQGRYSILSVDGDAFSVMNPRLAETYSVCCFNSFIDENFDVRVMVMTMTSQNIDFRMVSREASLAERAMRSKVFQTIESQFPEELDGIAIPERAEQMTLVVFQSNYLSLKDKSPLLAVTRDAHSNYNYQSYLLTPGEPNMLLIHVDQETDESAACLTTTDMAFLPELATHHSNGARHLSNVVQSPTEEDFHIALGAMKEDLRKQIQPGRADRDLNLLDGYFKETRGSHHLIVL